MLHNPSLRNDRKSFLSNQFLDDIEPHLGVLFHPCVESRFISFINTYFFDAWCFSASESYFSHHDTIAEGF